MGPPTNEHQTTSAAPEWLQRLVNVQPGELHGLFWAFGYHFLLLCSYYILRPIRDEMGIASGVDKLQWLFLATFAAMMAIVPLFGWLTSRLPRRRYLPYAYSFFIAHILGFFVLFEMGIAPVHVARAFFVWLSVFSLFVVSVFWSFMSDIFSDAQSKRLFGFIAAGGSAGALTGPVIAGFFSNLVGISKLLLVSAGMLLCVLFCISQLSRGDDTQQAARDEANHAAPALGAAEPLEINADADSRVGGGLWSGIRLVLRSRYLLGISVVIWLYTMLSTFLYFQQAHIVESRFAEAADRTAVFAGIDFAVNALTLGVQTLLTGRIVRAFGLPWTLALVPLLVLVGFGAIAVAPLLAVFVVVQVVRRAGNYAVMKPAREMLYVVLGREEKYKAKNFIDTAVYRGGDAVSAWVFAGLLTLGLSLGQTAWVAVPVSALWAWVAFRLGKKREALAAAVHPQDVTTRT